MRLLVTSAVLILTACAPIGEHGTGKHAPDANTSKLDGGTIDGPRADAAGPDAMVYTPTLFLGDWDTKYCAAAFACRNNYPSNTGQTFSQAFGQNTSDCHAILTSYDMPTTVEMQVTSGGIHWNLASAQTCIASFGYTCNAFWNNGPTYTGTSCPNALVGTVPDNGNCLTTWQCQNWTSYCDPDQHKCTAGN
jgi:hypothetical protein